MLRVALNSAVAHPVRLPTARGDGVLTPITRVSAHRITQEPDHRRGYSEAVLTWISITAREGISGQKESNADLCSKSMAMHRKLPLTTDRH